MFTSGSGSGAALTGSGSGSQTTGSSSRCESTATSRSGPGNTSGAAGISGSSLMNSPCGSTSSSGASTSISSTGGSAIIGCVASGDGVSGAGWSWPGSSRKISRASSISRSGTLLTSGRIGAGSSAGVRAGAIAPADAISNAREPASARNRSGMATAKAWSMAAAPTGALGRRPTRNSISRKSSTRSRQASHRRRWSRAHSRSFPSSRSSSTALGEMRLQRVPSKLDVVIDLPEFGTTAVQGMHKLAWCDIDHVAELVVREFYEVTQQDHGARFEGQSSERSLDRVSPQGSPGVRLWKTIEAQQRGAVPPKPAARFQGLPAELGGCPKHIGAPQAVTRGAMAQGNLAKSSTRDADGTIDVIDQPGDVVQDEREVRIELAFHGRGPRARNWSFDVYLIHYWDVWRMRAV